MARDNLLGRVLINGSGVKGIGGCEGHREL